MEVIYGSTCSTPSPCPHGLECHSQGGLRDRPAPTSGPAKGPWTP